MEKPSTTMTSATPRPPPRSPLGSSTSPTGTACASPRFAGTAPWPSPFCTGERWLDLLHLDRVANQAKRLRPDEDLAGLRGLLQAGGDVDGVAGGEALLGAGDDLSGVDADAGLNPQLGEGVAHLHRCSDRAQGVVLVHLGHAEDGHDRVADELLDRAAVALDDPLHPLEAT